MSVDADSPNGEESDDESHPTEEEQVETEWHFWLFAILVGSGVALILFPPAFWPELGFALLAVAVVGWGLKILLEKAL